METTKVTEVTEKNEAEETTKVVEKENIFTRVKNSVVETAGKLKDGVIRNKGKLVGAGIAGVAAIGLGLALKCANDHLDAELSANKHRILESLSDTASDAVDTLTNGDDEG